jgi:uncharacterized repeat protein (TIGR02543 family)
VSSFKAGATLGSLGKLPVATRKGYAFLGWYTAATGGDKVGESTVVTADATFYAHWKAKTYKVKFNVNGGKKITASTTVKISKTTTYYAHWKRK